jgi:hypothetical protein
VHAAGEFLTIMQRSVMMIMALWGISVMLMMMMMCVRVALCTLVFREHGATHIAMVAIAIAPVMTVTFVQVSVTSAARHVRMCINHVTLV